MTKNEIEIRQATVNDASTILKFITELAIYEKQECEVKATLEEIENSLFAQGATVHAIICMLNNEPIGFAVYFYNYSTWLGKHGLYLEDLYVSTEYRNVGAGKAILKYLAKLAVEKKCGRFEWCVLDWNEPAIEFYKSIGANAQDEWVIYRLTGKALEAFAR
ncbi:GNAT family N-acetyltransferase [Photobacterium halotolerans]|uniref:GNAT family N-acetyltransferase n=1 Tax=Photobacterium halotolerans TaxID=265726 RepID=A0A7X4WGF0_9GAMM|nr:GNAT family N-acetyltransferase [Photobacterium halotolerans]NAW67485.1 GNAT family N-acetyltransferase [Photobacterium halotolerans]